VKRIAVRSIKDKEEKLRVEALCLAVPYCLESGFSLPKNPEGAHLEELVRTLDNLNRVPELTKKINQMAEEYKKLLVEAIEEVKNEKT